MLSFREFLNDSSHKNIILEKSAIVDYYLSNPNKMKSVPIEISKKAGGVDIKQSITFAFNNSLKGKEVREGITSLQKELAKFKDELKQEYKEVNPSISSFFNFNYSNDFAEYMNFKKDRPKLNTPILDKLKDKIAKYINLEYISRNYADLYLDKMALQFGTKKTFLIDALKELKKYRSMSGQKIDAGAIEAIKMITVDKAPGKIYRGWFVDGEKISKVKGIESLKAGDTFSFSFGKPSSWSTFKETAYSFASAQDMIKDSENGYMMVISYKPKKEEVVADLRSPILSSTTGYYNQQEIILETGKKTFTVEWINKGDDYKKASAQTVGGSGGSSSLSSIDILNRIIKSVSLNPTLKKYTKEFEQAEEISELITNQVMRRYSQIITIPIYDALKNELYRLSALLGSSYQHFKITDKKGTNFFRGVTKIISTKGFDGHELEADLKITNYEKLFTKPNMIISNMKLLKHEEEVPMDDNVLNDVVKNLSDYFNIEIK